MTKEINIFAEVVEDKALEQFEGAMEQDFAIKGALMPDAHAGYSLPIGAVIATDGVVLPSWVGYDIGCGMCAVKTTFSRDEVKEKARKIYTDIGDSVPVGFNHNKKDSIWDYGHLDMTSDMAAIFNKNGLRQLGTLGGGNHFIEIGYDESDIVWIVVHSGSRGIGHAAARHYMKMASGTAKAKEGHYGFKADSCEWVDYIKDQKFCLSFALENRYQIIKRTVAAINISCFGEANYMDMINRNHNHAEEKDGMWIHRKGATHAEEGMMGVIPGNMRDGSFIVKGKGNPSSLWSSSHGAGRVLGRKAAKNNLSIDFFTQTMKGVVANVSPDTLDEAPNAYKNIFEVMRAQEPLVKTLHHVRPIINIKG